jgi:hypothetical protein
MKQLNSIWMKQPYNILESINLYESIW